MTNFHYHDSFPTFAGQLTKYYTLSVKNYRLGIGHFVAFTICAACYKIFQFVHLSKAISRSLALS